LLEGIDVASLEAQYNVSLAPRLAPLREAGLIHLHNGCARLVPERLAVSNEVFVQLLGATVDT
jgi:coproporphyrinogen III oxidase-like Fe-S oxidoreductase